MLDVQDLQIFLRDRRLIGPLSFSVATRETLAVVGESGSGKTLTSLAVMGLLPPTMRATGTIRLDEVSLLDCNEDAYCRIRGRRIGMIFQEPMTALNPVMTIGAQIAEGLVKHRLMDAGEAGQEAIRLIRRVGLPEAEARAHAYPHELSGGQRQRALIAQAIACRPQLLIADEPTSALDVTVQAEILALISDLREETGMAVLFVSHDLAVVSRLAERTMVLYGGAAMELGPTRAMLASPRNPYTRGLLDAIPRGHERQARLRPISGQVPSTAEMPLGCPFSTRCGRATETCRKIRPMAQALSWDVFCHHPEGEAA